MNNFYIAFATYLNLIFVTAKLWDRIHWSWFWVMSPIIAMTVIGIFAVIGQYARRNRMRSALPENLAWVTDFLRRYQESARKERQENNSTIN